MATTNETKSKGVNLIKVNKALSLFISESLSEQFTITGLKKEGKNWSAIAEVYEDSAFIQTIGKKTGAKDRNLYSFLLSDELEVVAFEKSN